VYASKVVFHLALNLCFAVCLVISALTWDMALISLLVSAQMPLPWFVAIMMHPRFVLPRPPCLGLAIGIHNNFQHDTTIVDVP
jgi:hypothetical protein